MEKFPQLKSGHVALLRAEFGTGTVLDEQFKPVVNNGQKVYSILKHKTEAFELAKALMVKNPNIECVIYGQDEEVLLYLTPQNISHIYLT